MKKNEVDSLIHSTTLCAYCPKMCRFACPVAETENRESVTPWGKMSLLYLGWQGQMPLHEESAVKALEACTGCGACVEQCAHGNPVAETLFSARKIVQTPRSKEMRKAFLETGDVRRRNLHEFAEPFSRSADAEVVYFPGCTQLTHSAKSIHKAQKLLLQALGVEVPVCDLPSGSWCCGYPLYADGHLDVLASYLDFLFDSLFLHKLVITPDPGCAYVLSVVAQEISQAKNRPKILPLVEVLAEHHETFTNVRRGLRVKYHDPCYLGRRGRSFSAPRRLLASATGLQVMEFAQNREEADCSGGGGLYPVSNPEASKKMARRRIEVDPNAHQIPDVVATACPSALRAFHRAGIEAVDIMDILADGVAGEEKDD